jgi:hypothetical protein
MVTPEKQYFVSNHHTNTFSHGALSLDPFTLKGHRHEPVKLSHADKSAIGFFSPRNLATTAYQSRCGTRQANALRRLFACRRSPALEACHLCATIVPGGKE